jgi:hypothetical protein
MTRNGHLAVAAVTGLLVTLPFMILEWVTSSDAPRSDFSTLMFGVMAVSAGLFALMLMQAARTVRAGNMTIARSTSVVLRAVLVGLIGSAWLGLVVDQMPCFLGAKGC